MGDCIECGHPAKWHGDRALVACSVRPDRAWSYGNVSFQGDKKCWCWGYKEDRNADR